MEAQRRRLEKENDQLAKNIASLEKQLSDESFLARAPQQVVANMRTKLSEYKAQLAKNKSALESLE
jgi:valyl-tRNA synthetase